MAKPRDIIAFIQTLTLTGGDCDGKPFRVLPWERKFIGLAFGAKAGDSAYLSCARANGKTAVVAAIATCVIDPAGPLHGRRRDVIVVSASFQLARITFDDVLHYLRARHDLNDKDWRLQDSANNALIEHRPSGARVKCIGSDPNKMAGLRPYLMLLDETSSWLPPERGERAFALCRTSIGKQPGSKLIGFSTRAKDEHHFFSRELKKGNALVYAAGKDDDPLDEATWRKANPSWSQLPTLRAKIRAEAKDAERDPATLQTFRALRLNLGVSEVESASVLDPELWKALEVESGERVGNYILGLDLGSTEAMSAAVAIWENGYAECFACFPKEPGLRERGLADGVSDLYADMAARDELIQRGRRSSDVDGFLAEILNRWGTPETICADFWRSNDDLIPALDRIKFPQARLLQFNPGYRTASRNLRDFKKAVLEAKLAPRKSLLMRAGLAEAVVVWDDMGNSKLAKLTEGGRRRRARDDVVAAAIVAGAEWYRRSLQPKSRGAYLGKVA